MYVIYLSQKRERRLAMQDSDSSAWKNRAILSLSRSKSYSTSIYIASVLGTKNTFKWLIYHDDILYASAYRVNTCQVSSLSPVSLPRRYAIEIVFIDWRVSDGTSAIAFVCNLKDPSDVSNGGECTRCTRTRVYDAVDVRTYAFSRYVSTQK